MEENVSHPVEKVPAGTDKRLTYTIIAAIVIAMLLVGYFVFISGGDDPQAKAREEALALVETVSRLIVLPDEEPVIATVADPSKLTEQPFFANAIEGDKVLIFNVSRKAVLYRPSEDRIIEVAPLTIGQ